MNPNKLSPTLPKRSSGRRSHFESLSKAKLVARRDEQLEEEEVRRIKQSVLDLCAQLDRTDLKVAAHLKHIDQNLADMASLREQIRILERGLGIERQG